MIRYSLIVAAVAALATFAPNADAARSNVRIGIGIGIPIYPRPHYHPHYHPVVYPYYRPYPMYVAPAPIYYAPPPVVVQPAPVVYQQAPVPVVRPAAANSGTYEPPPAAPRAIAVSQSDASGLIQQLFDQQDTVRANAAIELGRMKSAQAVDPLCTLVSTDRSPIVRETAARALGLIGDPRGLSALQNAAQGDSDRDVRRSAQFAVEVIRANQR